MTMSWVRSRRTAAGTEEPIARRWRVLGVLTLLVLASVVVPASPASATTLPPGFTDTLVTTVDQPMALAWTPDNRMLIATKTGQVRVHRNGALLATPALDLAARLCTNAERGLLGIAVDPQFSTTGYVYVYYTFDKFGGCEIETARTPVNRVSRFTMNRTTNVIAPSSELILINNIPSYGGSHNAGDVKIGKDGLLYISVGDGICDYRGDSGCSAANDAARDRHALVGKVLRITRTGGIPTNNPYRGTFSSRCNVNGRTSAGRVCQETFAWGLRNPFRMAFDQNATGTRFFINDVGQDVFDEVDLGRSAADYGWNTREGFCATGSTTDCGPPPSGMTNPVFAYGQEAGCAAITGGAFLPASWPAPYGRTYVFGDWRCKSMFLMQPAAGGGYTSTLFASDLPGSSPVAVAVGPIPGGSALYYTNLSGEVRRIALA